MTYVINIISAINIISYKNPCFCCLALYAIMRRAQSLISFRKEVFNGGHEVLIQPPFRFGDKFNVHISSDTEFASDKETCRLIKWKHW